MVGNFVGKGSTSDVTNKADKVTNATNGDFAGLDSTGNLTDSGYKASDFVVPVATTQVAGKVKPDGTTISVSGDGTLSATNSGTVTSVKVGSTPYDPEDGVVSLPAYPTSLPASDKTNSYSPTGTAPVTGTAVNSALQTLDVTGESNISAGKTIKSWSETDGKVSVATQDISITKSQVSDFPTLGTAAAKNFTTSVTQNSGDLVTSGAVWTAIDNLPEPMVFKGSLGTGGTITDLPTASASNTGFTYKVITAGTYASQAAKVGDLFISDGSSWVYIPSADEPSGTVTSVGVANGGGLTVSGSPVTSSGTITVSHADTSSQASVSNSGRTYIQSVTLDTYGHVTGLSSATETVVNTDRYVNSASFADDSTNNNVKMTLTRAGSDTATVTANIPKVSSSSAGVAPKGAAVSSQSQSTKFLREDGTWAAPSYTTDTNTTYTFANGTNGFTVTPSGGSAQTVTVTPSIAAATTAANGLMSKEDKTKLNGVATGAEVNQNAFSNVVVGSTTIAADAKTDTLTLAAGSNITLTPDASNDKVTIAATDTNTTYTLATGDSNGQIKVTPSSGSAYNVGVKGLGSAAYTASTAYATNSTLTNQDLNSVTTPGFYAAGGGNTVSNKPSGVDAFGLEVIHSASGNYYTQIIYSNDSAIPYRRACTNGTWAAWSRDKYTDTTYSAGSNITLSGTSFSLTKANVTGALGYTPPTSDTNTTYTFANGTNGFTVTPSGGSAQTVSVTPSIAVATTAANGLMASGDKTKLNGIASGAEVNQNAFSNIAVGSTTVSADSKTDTLTLAAGSNVTITPDATNDKITIAATNTNTTYTFANGTNGFTVTPSGGSAQTVTVTPSISNNVTGSGTSGYIAKWNGTNTVTNGPAFGTATNTYLRNDGSWATPTDTNNAVAQTATTTSADYEVLFSATADNTTRTEGARKNSNLKFNPSTGNLQATQLNGVTIGSSPKFTDNNTTYTFANGTNGFTVTPSGGSAQTVTVTPSIAAATTAANGLMASGDKTKLNGIATGAEVNQNAFSNVKVGSTTVAADSKTDTLELVAGSNVTLTPDATNDKVTIAATNTNTTYTFANGTNGFTVTPSGGSAQTVKVTPSIAAATTAAAGLMAAADKVKLNGIATGAEVNQNAFSNVVVGNTTISADAKTDTLTLTAGSNITLTPDATNDKVTIAATNTDTKMSKKRYTVTASSWSGSTDSSGYYTYTVTLSSPTLNTSYPPNVYIAGSGDSTFPTDTEKAAYALLENCNLTASSTLVLYAKTKPTTTFYVYVEGQQS